MTEPQKFKSLISTKKIKFSTIQTNKGYGYGIKKSIYVMDYMLDGLMQIYRLIFLT